MTGSKNPGVRFTPFRLTSNPEPTLMCPPTSSAYDGLILRIPTRLLEESTLNVFVSTVTSPATPRLVRLPTLVRLELTTLEPRVVPLRTLVPLI